MIFKYISIPMKPKGQGEIPEKGHFSLTFHLILK